VLARVAANQCSLFSLGEAAADATVGGAEAMVWRWQYSAITGAAGTGKTTVIRQLVAAARRQRLRVAVAALTGRAAARLGTHAQTLHRLLGYGPWGWGVKRLSADLVIVDEASMLTWDAAAALFEAAPGRVVLVGDPGQLPPVSGERAFAELLARLPVYELARPHRQRSAQSVQALVCETEREMLTTMAATVREWARQRVSWQVLTPYRHGPLGCERLNRLLQDLANPTGSLIPGTPYRMGDRVALTRAVPACGLPNGWIGELKQVTDAGAWLSGRQVVIGPVPLDALELAYAVTVDVPGYLQLQGQYDRKTGAMRPMTGTISNVTNLESLSAAFGEGAESAFKSLGLPGGVLNVAVAPDGRGLAVTGVGGDEMKLGVT
jgi:ATP-dependent exoDNAse (exonuclease V) alpha subunit